MRELKGQGLGNKVIADMFGLTLRTYHDRVRRTSESLTDRGSSLWEAVLRYARQRQVLSRGELLSRFRADDEASVRGVLSDLVDSGLLFKSGRGDHTTYRAASDAESSLVLAGNPAASAAGMIWVLLHQRGPQKTDELARELNLSEASVEQALASLLAQGRCRQEGDTYRADHCLILYGDEIGWEAALFDHFQAMVTAIASKVTQGKNRSALGEATGGSTYHFDLYRGHPKEQEVLNLLTNVRERASALRVEVERMSAAEPAVAAADAPEAYRVVFYVGQNAVGLDSATGEQE